MANTVQVTFEIDRDGSGRTVLRQIDTDINRIGSTARNTGRALDGAFTVFKGTLAADFFKRAASEAISFGKSAVQSFNQVQNATLGLQSIAIFKGISPSDATQAVQNLSIVKLGLISTGDAAKALKDLLTRFNLDQSLTALERFADIASVNRQNGLSLSEAVVTGAQAVKNLNSILLDNLGISKNISLITKDYGFSMEDLDDPTKRVAANTAFYNGLLKETVPFVGKASEVAGTFQGKLISLDATWAKLQQTVGQAIAQNPEINKGLSELGVNVGKLIVDLSNADSPVRKTIDSIVSGAGSAIQALARLTDFVREHSGLVETLLVGGAAVGAGGFAASKILGLVTGIANASVTIKTVMNSTAEAGEKGFSKLDIAAKGFVGTLNLIAAHPAIAALVAIGAVVSVASVLIKNHNEDRRDAIGSLSSLPQIGDSGISDDQLQKLDEKIKSLKKIQQELDEFKKKTIPGELIDGRVKLADRLPDQQDINKFLAERGFESGEADLNAFEQQVETFKKLALEKRKALEAAKKAQAENPPLNKEDAEKTRKFIVGIRDNVRDALNSVRGELTRDNPFTAAFSQADKASDTFAQKVEQLGAKVGNVGDVLIAKFEAFNQRALALEIFKAEIAQSERISNLLSEASNLKSDPVISRAFEIAELNKRLELIRRRNEIGDLEQNDERSRVLQNVQRGGNRLQLRDFDRANDPIKIALQRVQAIFAQTDGDLNSFQSVLDSTQNLDFTQIEAFRRSSDPFTRSKADDLERIREARRRAFAAARGKARTDFEAVDPGVAAAKRALDDLNKFDPRKFENERDQRTAQAALLDKVIAIGQQIDPAKMTDELKQSRVKALEQRADLERQLKKDAENDRAEQQKVQESINSILGLLYKRLGERAIFKIVDETTSSQVEIEEILGAADRTIDRQLSHK